MAENFNNDCPRELEPDPCDEMRDRFWLMFINIKFKERFYDVHSRRAYNFNFLYGAVTLIISFVCTLIWTASGSAPVLWALLIALAQLAQSLKDSFIWGKQLSALEYFLPEVQTLLLDIEDTWNKIDFSLDEWDALKIDEKRSEYTRRFSELEVKYIGSTYFPQRKRVCNKAMTERLQYFENRYKIPKETE